MADKYIQLMSEDGTDNLYPVGKLDLLWTNSSPTASFSSQTVSLDLSKYRLVMISYCYSYNSEYYQTMIQPVDGLTYRCTTGNSTNNNNGVRAGTATATGVVFTAGAYNGASNNQYVIPYKIYGIR